MRLHLTCALATYILHHPPLQPHHPGALGQPTVGLVASHGAGLANAFFLRPSALLAEIDSIRNALVARNYFQYLAAALGLRPFKVWLSTLGIRSSVSKRMALLKTAMPLTAAKPRQ